LHWFLNVRGQLPLQGKAAALAGASAALQIPELNFLEINVIP